MSARFRHRRRTPRPHKYIDAPYATGYCIVCKRPGENKTMHPVTLVEPDREVEERRYGA